MAKKEINYNNMEKNPFIAIPSSLAGIFLVVTILFLLLAKESLGMLVSLIWGFVVLGIVAMAFAHDSLKKKKN